MYNHANMFSLTVIKESVLESNHYLFPFYLVYERENVCFKQCPVLAIPMRLSTRESVNQLNFGREQGDLKQQSPQSMHAFDRRMPV